MERHLPRTHLSGRFGASAAILAGLISQNLGAAFAKTLFAEVGALGATALRVTLAAMLLCALLRPWRSLKGGPGAWRAVVAYGVTLGLMNILIYQAFARIPIGLAVAIELMGPMAVALLGARRMFDLAPAVVAAAGLALLLPVAHVGRLDPLGLAFAAAAALTWAAYILLGARLADRGGGPGVVALGMIVAALVSAPLGLQAAGAALLAPHMLAAGLGLAVLSSALPYTLEMAALRQISARVFGLLMCAAPAIAAVLGWILLGERLGPAQVLAILLITAACVMGALSGRAQGEANAP